MSRFACVIAAAALLPLAALAGENNTHSEYLASVATYKPIQGFNHVVGEKRFVGYFTEAESGCNVTVIEAIAGDDRLTTPPVRHRFELTAGGRAEVSADHGQALGIGCTADANEIKVVTLKPRTADTVSR